MAITLRGESVPEFDFAPGQPMLELAEWLTEKTPGSVAEARRTLARIPISERFLEGLVAEAMATLYARTVRGCRLSAQFIVQMLYGSLDTPFREKVEAMTLDEARSAIYELIIAQGRSHQQAIDFIESLNQPVPAVAAKAGKSGA